MVILITGTTYQIKKEIPGVWLQHGFMCSSGLTFVNGAVNPFIYGIRYKEIGQEMKKLMKKIFYLRQSPRNVAIESSTISQSAEGLQQRNVTSHYPDILVS